MKKTYEDSTSQIFENERGTIFGIVKDNSRKAVYTVTAREPGQKGKTIATRCNYDTALSLIKEYE